MPQTGIVRLFTSSKSLAVLGAMLMVFVLMLMHIDPEPFMAFAWKVVTAYVLGSSAEDVAQKIATRPSAPTPAPSAVATINTMPPPPLVPGDIPQPTIDWGPTK